jgi:hypothetical protein
MNNPADLLQKWESLPNIQPSESWQNQLLQRAQRNPPRKKEATSAGILFTTFVLGFVLLNAFFIRQTWQPHDDKPLNSREQAFMGLSQQFLSKPF